jgi:hypothetical protein
MIDPRPFLDGMRAWLLADSAITALVGNRVYIGLAPRTAAMPFIVVDLSRLDPTHATEVEQVEGRYQLKAVVDADQHGWVKMLQIVSAMGERLSDELPTADDWTFDLFWQEGNFSYPEPVENRVYVHGGFSYRFHATKATEV